MQTNAAVEQSKKIQIQIGFRLLKTDTQRTDFTAFPVLLGFFDVTVFTAALPL